MPSAREMIQAALEQREELDEFSGSLAVPPSDDVRDPLQFCSGMEGILEQIDFTGRSFRDGFGPDVLLPHGHPIAHDGCGNFWAVGLQLGSDNNWGPIYFVVTMRR